MKDHSLRTEFTFNNFLPFAIFPRRLGSKSRVVLAVALTLASSALAAHAGKVYLPNYSFESPALPNSPESVVPEFDYWQETPQPGDYDTNVTGYAWFELVGEFYNATNDGAYISNADGNQCAYIFSIPGAGIFQDYNSVSVTEGGPTHAFNATFNPGHVYKLKAGFLPDPLFGPTPGTTFQMSLYYRDASNNMVTVASTTITNTTNAFPSDSELVDFTVETSVVNVGDAAAGQNIGILFVSTVDEEDMGGLWDMDNVRLEEELYVPNYSFESPALPNSPESVVPEFDYWQETPQPGDYDTNLTGYAWFELVGEFYNATNDGAYISNADGNQCAYIFSIPGAGIYQDYNSVSDTQSNPTHAFNATFNPGHAHKLKAAFLPDPLFGPTPGTTFQMSLYYRDASSNMVTVASTTITNTTNAFPSGSQLVDFEVQTPAVKVGDAAAGQNIGILFVSTVDEEDMGGLWDLDNVRLVETVAPALSNSAELGGQFNFTLLSEPGLSFNVLAATNVTTPGTNWTSLGAVTNVTGSTPFTDTATNLTQRFYRLQEL